MTNKKEVRLLILDESERYSKAIRECAEMSPPDYQLTVQFADNEKKALEIMKNWDPSVVLLDAHMPRLDAFDVLERYMAEIVPVIVTSSSTSRDIEASARSHGAIGYFAKSENPDEIEWLLSSIGNVSINFEVRH